MSGRLNRIRRQFDRSAAGGYETHAAVQRTMAGHLAAGLPHPQGSDDVLEIGCGTGFLTGKLAAGAYRSVTALDLAPSMLEAAGQRTAGLPADIRFVLADVERWAAEPAREAEYDLIVSSACFQWLEHPAGTLGHLRGLLRPGGMLAFATFGPGTFRELHEAFARTYAALGLKPERHGLSFREPEEWQADLINAGFSRVRFERFEQAELYTSVPEFLHAVKGVGASVSEAAGRPGLGSRRLFLDMFRRYEERYGAPEGITATYELVYFQAEQPCIM
ncbi:malonyl-[acyl-carrier protein] O-methyltransferase BioC [Paenibacillus sambharensis]|uniref:Malonyl-[acyl-carrier protein] O-methyltransferase n=1 Tax=Paenibacillus sambharensis TaxID=1803190 RepID=A0A2W1LX96_9BACL|nr:malonyl-ACP O-methyltransferase BioC [Paenibacillus sambharensis]PZD96341.1 malonyl-[acyl-carrier protein] O-methyltransferase BioC [Paenibacillus sambharensis]